MDNDWSDYNIVLPGRIVEYFPANQTATIQLSGERVLDTASESDLMFDRGTLQDVPVHTASGGGWSMTFPIKAGDTCLLLFSQHGYDHWLWQDKDEAGKVAGRSAPWLRRKFNVADGLALVGFNTIPRAVQTYAADHSQWRNEDATQRISLDANETDIDIATPGDISQTAATKTTNVPETVHTGNITQTGDLSVTGTISHLGVRNSFGSYSHLGPLTLTDGAGAVTALGNGTTTFTTSAPNDANGSAVIQTKKSTGAVSGFVGRLTATTLGFYASSDRRLKRNVSSTNQKESLDNINDIHVVDFDVYADTNHEHGDKPEARMRGVIAQDFAKVYPDNVVVGSDPEKLLSITDAGLVWELVNAVQALTSELEDVKAQLALTKKDKQ